MEIIDCNKAEVSLYQVKRGDNISTICAKFNIQTNNIIRNNPNVDLYEGEVVKIVRKTTIQHIVKPMETLTSISQKYDVDVDDIIKTNNLTSKRLFVGQSLIINDK